jgi:hypothetical protein
VRLRLVPGPLEAAARDWFGRFPASTEARADAYLWVHRGAADRPAPQARQCDVPGHPIAANGPICCAPEAVPSTTLTSPALSTASHANAVQADTPGPGSVSPALPCQPTSAHSSDTASTDPAN